MKSFLFWVCLMAMGVDPCLAQITATVSLGNTSADNIALDSTGSDGGSSRMGPTTLRSPDSGNAKDDTPDNSKSNSNITTSSRPVLSLSWPRVRPQAQPKNDECVPYAAAFHQVSDSVLRAILLVESGMNPNTINKNANGTIDLGLGGMNSVHFQELAKFGIAPVHLLNACVATYVTAWQLKKQFTQYGVTWFAIGAYHSITPYFNQRYQILIYNQLLKIHALQGAPLPVPPMTPKPG